MMSSTSVPALLQTRDTSPAATERYIVLLRSVPKPVRLMRAVDLTVFVRSLAWSRAAADAETHPGTSVVERFVAKLYGSEAAQRVAKHLAARVTHE